MLPIGLQTTVGSFAIIMATSRNSLVLLTSLAAAAASSFEGGSPVRRLEGAAAVLHDQSLAAAPAAPAPNTTTVSLAPGQVLVGAVKEGQRHFMGVPFAAPPLGDRRWTAPAPPAAWLGPREALTPGDTCVQSDNAAYTLGGGMSEDCLYLNVFAPLTDGVAAAASKPVLLFFYGGSWDSGSASCPLYYGGNLVATTDDVIVVTANYRVNAFGFLGVI